jgi:hexulose-6-phosphate isomerase
MAYSLSDMMASGMSTRREFLSRAALASLASPLLAPAATRNIRKAIMYATISMEGSSVLQKFQAVKAAGFAGVEPMSHMTQSEVLDALHQTGLEAASVCGCLHWKNPLSDPSAEVRKVGLEALLQTLRDAKAYGASSVLLVPAVVNKNVSYQDAWTRSQAEIRKALPLAKELNVRIAVENVWNFFLLSPLEAKRYIDEFESPYIGWHLDLGNVVNYGWPEQWVTTLGKRVLKLHIKEYSRAKRDKTGPTPASTCLSMREITTGPW